MGSKRLKSFIELLGGWQAVCILNYAIRILTAIAANNVMKNETKTIKVAMARVGANIFLT